MPIVLPIHSSPTVYVSNDRTRNASWERPANTQNCICSAPRRVSIGRDRHSLPGGNDGTVTNPGRFIVQHRCWVPPWSDQDSERESNVPVVLGRQPTA